MGKGTLRPSLILQQICPAARAVGFFNKWHNEDGWMDVIF
jgi:hypothetical protein